MEQQFDILVALSVSTMITPYKSNPEDFSLSSEEQKSHSDSKSAIIEINWCAYDLKRQIVIDEVQYYIKPPNFSGKLTEETMQKTNVRPESLFNAFSLYEVIQKFNDFLYLTFVRNNLSFCLVTYGEELLTKTLPNESREYKIKLAYHFIQYFDIKTEFYKFSSNNNITTLKDMLSYLGLKEVPAETICQNNCKTLVRIINMLTRSNHIFTNPKLVSTTYPQPTEKEPPKDNNSTVLPKMNSERKKYSSYIKYRSPDLYKFPYRKFFIRLRGLPYSAKEPEVIEFLRGIQINSDDIQFLYNNEGKFTGETYVRLHSENDLKEAMSFNLSEMGNRYIEIFDSSINEFEKARNSQYPDKKEFEEIKNFNGEDNNGIIRMRGLPYSCNEDDIIDFFKGLKIGKNNVKRAVVGGRPSGEAYVIFDNKEDAIKALNFNMEKIGSRFIELFSSSVRELENYLHNNCSNQGNNSNIPSFSKEMIPNIPFEKRKCTLMCFGLPFNVTKEAILDFFSDYRINEKDVYFINNQLGRFSGNILVIFEDELETQRALRTRNLAYLGNRYIEIYEYR